MVAPVHLGQGNPYALDWLWQIKERDEHDKTQWIISPHTVNIIRKLRIQTRRKWGKKGGVKVHRAILASKRSVNINNLIQIKAKATTIMIRHCGKILNYQLQISSQLKTKTLIQ